MLLDTELPAGCNASHILAGPDAGTPGQPKADLPTPAAPKLEAPKLELPKLEAPKPPKIEAPKLDVPKPPKVEAPKAPSIPTPSAPALPQQEGKLFRTIISNVCCNSTSPGIRATLCLASELALLTNTFSAGACICLHRRNSHLASSRAMLPQCWCWRAGLLAMTLIELEWRMASAVNIALTCTETRS